MWQKADGYGHGIRKDVESSMIRFVRIRRYEQGIMLTGCVSESIRVYIM